MSFQYTSALKGWNVINSASLINATSNQAGSNGVEVKV